MTNDQANSTVPNLKRAYDLEERTLSFGKAIINLSSSIPKNVITVPLISQLVRSGTSIGANYAEAEEASSKRDFVNKIAIANKEAKETKSEIIRQAVDQYLGIRKTSKKKILQAFDETRGILRGLGLKERIRKMRSFW